MRNTYVNNPLTSMALKQGWCRMQQSRWWEGAVTWSAAVDRRLCTHPGSRPRVKADFSGWHTTCIHAAYVASCVFEFLRCFWVCKNRFLHIYLATRWNLYTIAFTQSWWVDKLLRQRTNFCGNSIHWKLADQQCETFPKEDDARSLFRFMTAKPTPAIWHASLKDCRLNQQYEPIYQYDTNDQRVIYSLWTRFTATLQIMYPPGAWQRGKKNEYAVWEFKWNIFQ